MNTRVYCAKYIYNMFYFFILARRSVAFTASCSGTISYEKLVFNDVITNEGGGYSGSTGIFTCPSSGVYVFIWTIRTEHGKYCGANLSINGNVQSKIRARVYLGGVSADNVYSMATMSGTFRLTKGDQVWIRSQDCNYFALAPDNAFSGWKV